MRSWLSHQHALDATPLAFSNVTLNKVFMYLDAMLLTFSCNFQHTLDAPWCYAPDFLINTLLMLWPWLSAMSLWTWSWCILMLCSWISHVTSNTLLMHLDATLLTFSSTRSCGYTLGFLQRHFEQGLDASWCYALGFLMYFPTHSWCILMLRSWLSLNTLLMLRPWLSTMSLWTRSWCILMLCS